LFRKEIPGEKKKNLPSLTTIRGFLKTETPFRFAEETAALGEPGRWPEKWDKKKRVHSRPWNFTAGESKRAPILGKGSQAGWGGGKGNQPTQNVLFPGRGKGPVPVVPVKRKMAPEGNATSHQEPRLWGGKKK